MQFLRIKMNRENCIFCKIAKGEISSFKIYEQDDFIAFLDVNPLNPGHVLVIPKKHFRWVWDVDNVGEYFEVVKKIAKKLQEVMKTEYVASGIAGNEIPHAHIHLVPRFDSDGHGGWLDVQKIKKISSEEMKRIAEKIKSSLE